MAWPRKESLPDEETTHDCEYDYDDMDDLEVAVPGSNLDVRVRRRIKMRFLVSEKNRRTEIYMRSSEAVKQEKQRHLLGHYYMIHPFSDVRKYWEMVMLVILFLSLIVVPILIAWPEPTNSVWSWFILATDLFCLVDVALHFATGTLKPDTKEIVMRPKMVAWAYLKSMFIFDFLGAIPADTIDILIGSLLHGESVTPWEPLRLLKMLRIIRFMVYFDNTCQVYHVSVIKKRCMQLGLFIAIVLHFSTCAQYYLTIWSQQLSGSVAITKTWMGSQSILGLTVLERYLRSLHHIASISFGICVFFSHESAFEQNMSLIFIVLGQIMFYVLIVNAMHITNIQQSSNCKYQLMIGELQQFLVHKRLPLDVQRKAFDYYDFRFHKSYYVESEIMNSITETLRQDLVLHNCLRLIENVEFFVGLPQDLKIRLVGRLQNRFYLSDDVVISAEKPADTMYFIKSGTVAAYASTGKEICHLEDGQYFGELSMILKTQVKRMASVLAIENCELYILGSTEFLNAFEPFPELLESIQKNAKQRLKRTRGTEDTIEGV